MAWKHLGSPKTVKVTNKLAKEWAEMDAAHIDRPVSPRRLDLHEQTLKKGEFRRVSWARAYCKELDGWYRINGKHTATVFSKQDMAKYDVEAIVEEYECDTVEDMAKLYGTFDSVLSSRKTGDVNHAIAQSIPELREVKSPVINACVAAMEYAKRPTVSTGGYYRTPPEKANELFHNVNFVLWVNRLLNDVGWEKSIHIRRMPVIAAAYATFLKSMKAATEFWNSVRDMSDPDPESASRKLALFLVQMKLSQGRTKGIPERFRLTPREFYYKSISAWNAWRKGAKTELKYFASAKIPTAI
jgi:hypothetical protein